MHLFHQHAQLQFGEPGTHAAVDAISEGDVTPRIFAPDVEPFGVLEHAFVAVGRVVPQDHLVTCGDLLPEQFGILHAGAAHVLERGLVADAFLHRVGDQARVFLESLALVGEPVERMDDPAHGVARGIVAADDQQHQIAHEFLRVHLVHRRAVDHPADQVGRFALLRALRPQQLEIGRHFIQHSAPRFVEAARGRKLGIARPVGPVGQQVAVFPGKIEQDRQHAGGQRDGDRIDPVEHFAARQGIERFAGPLADVAFQPGHFRRGEGRRHGLALAGMLGPVHRDEHRQFQALFGRHVLEPIEDGDAAVFPAGGEDLGQGFGVLDRLVTDHRPIGAVGAVGDVVQRSCRAHLLEDRLPRVFEIDVAAAGVPLVRVGGAGVRVGSVVGFKRVVRAGRAGPRDLAVRIAAGRRGVVRSCGAGHG